MAFVAKPLVDGKVPTRPVVFSGNKSYHGWFDVREMEEEKAKEWFEYAIRLGADIMMYTLNQWTRIPGGINEKTGKEQKLIYFNL